MTKTVDKPVKNNGKTTAKPRKTTAKPRKTTAKPTEKPKFKYLGNRYTID